MGKEDGWEHRQNILWLGGASGDCGGWLKLPHQTRQSHREKVPEPLVFKWL